MAIRLASGANALETGNRVKAKMEELSKYFPSGMKVVYPYDTTPFVKISIEEVVETLIEAILLVILMLPFLDTSAGRSTRERRGAVAVGVVVLAIWLVLTWQGYSLEVRR